MNTDPLQAADPGPSRAPAGRSHLVWILLALGLALSGGLVLRGRALPVATTPVPPVVPVVRVEREDLAREVVVEAELRPFQEVDLHAKVAGYLESITVDIGDRVKAGQLLAVLDVPELADDLRRAEAMTRRCAEEVSRAEAARDAVHLPFERLRSVEQSHSNLVARQELDLAEANDRAAASTLAAARAQAEVADAELAKLRTMQRYARILAPFDGVVTRRFADPGALIQAGTTSATQAQPVVRISDAHRLRLSFPLSVAHVDSLRVGDPVEIRLTGSGRQQAGVVARTAGKVDPGTRKMEVEVDVPNEDLALIPGTYASVRLRLDRRARALVVPTEAVARGHGATVLAVDARHLLVERTVKLGLETAAKVEVLAGLAEGDLVLVGNRSRLRPGQEVDPRPAPTPNPQEP